MVKIIHAVNQFDYYDQDLILGSSDIQKMIKAPEPIAWASKQLISFYSKSGKYITIDLSGTLNDRAPKSLYWRNFSNDELRLFSELFQLNLRVGENVKQDNNLIALINNKYFSLPAELASTSSDEVDSDFVVIYYLSRADKIFEGKLYVHGIWEVTLSKELKIKLLQTSTKSTEQPTTLITSYFQEHFPTFALEVKNTHGPHWKVVYSKSGIKIVISGDVGFSIEIFIDNKEYKLWQFDRSVIKAMNTTEENIYYQLAILERLIKGLGII